MLYLVSFFIVFILFLLVIVYFVFKKSPGTAEQSTHYTQKETLEALLKIVVNEKKELFKVEAALDEMVKAFPFPESEKEAGEYFKFVYYYAKNPLPTAKMIVHMQKTLTEKNPKYAKQIEAFQMRGVEARNK